MNERLSLGGRVVERGEGPIGQAVEAYRAAEQAGRAEPGDLDRLMQLWTRAEAARLTNVRAAEAGARGRPGPEGSIAKLQMAELNKAIYDLALDFVGEEGLLFASFAETRPDFTTVHGGSGDLRYDYLRSLANSIEAARRRSCATCSASGCSACPANPGWTKTSPGARCQVPRS